VSALDASCAPGMSVPTPMTLLAAGCGPGAATVSVQGTLASHRGDHHWSVKLSSRHGLVNELTHPLGEPDPSEWPPSDAHRS
jgi:hypothetical protein